MQARSIRVRLILPLLLLLVLMGVALEQVLVRQLDKQSREVGRDRAFDMARVLAEAVRPSLEFDDPTGIQENLETIRRAEGAAYALVVVPGPKVLGLVVPNASAPRRADLEAGLAVDEGGWLHVAAPIVGVDGKDRGRLVVGFSTATRQQRIDESRVVVLLLTVIILCIGLTAMFIVSTRLLLPIVELSRTTARIVDERDLRIPIDVRGDDEIATLARAVADLVAAQRRSVGGVSRLAFDVAGVAMRVDEAGARVSEEARGINDQVATAASSVREVRAALEEGEKGVRTLVASARDVGSTLLEVNRGSDAAAQTLRALSQESQDTAGAVRGMLQSAERAAARLAASDVALERASRTMTRVVDAAQDVERSAYQTRELSLRVRDGAVAGRTLVGEVQSGVYAMGTSMDEVRGAIDRLSARVGQIELAVQVIQEVAEQTALLSLNAAIIAAQAGDMGRSFGVVATSIKGLSERTRNSASAIVAVIREVTDETSRAVDAVSRSRDAMQEGSRRSREAAGALEAILSDTADATTRLEEIATLTGGQVQGVRDVAAAIGEVMTSMRDVRTASKEQEEVGKRLQATARGLVSLASSADESLVGHGERSRSAADALTRMREIVEQLGGSQREQAQVLASVLAGVDVIAAASERQQGPVQDLVTAISDLRESATTLESETTRFRA